MYSAVELKELTIKPKINDISLEVLREFYEIFLHPFIYTYTIAQEDRVKTVALRFNTWNFCHLLGVETIAKRTVKYSELHNYRGEDGWNNVKNGTLDIRHLKNLNKKKFLSVKAKYVYFYLIPSLLETPLAVNYDKSKVMPPTNIDCELLFYSTYDNAVIHLGLEKEDEEEFYFPRTFFVEKLNKPEDKDIYIDNQEKIVVSKENRIIML
ncbi:PBECR4 domain-containing protein [Frisingicoccus sp.]|uniref:PBECR4 domain-containing protein n=1 Tax=Frisingicoccus sp. TaxID=1918627 RepID=UPI002E9EFA58|nr:PBECR4 domain-containing protein [Frisingicoccus sp.]